MSKALVTGAASGIGRATALAFAQAGATVALLDCDAAGLAETAKLLEDRAGPRLVCDVRDASAVRRAVQEAHAALGGLRWAFNGAGIPGPVADLADYGDDEFAQVLDVNLKGVWNCLKAEIAVMTTGGAIVNCASIGGLCGLTRIAGYVASKHAIVGLTKTAALELAPRGLRVNAVCPGPTETPMLADYDAAKKQRLAAVTPLGRLAMPAEVAAAVAWLCSEGASFLTGHALAVDGGWCAQ